LIEFCNRRPVASAAALPRRAVRVDKAVVSARDVATAELAAKLNQFFLVGAFVEDKENVDSIERVDSLDREVFGIAGTDADDQDLLHRGARLWSPLQVAFENTDMNGRRVDGLRPQILRPEAHVIGALVLRSQIVGGSVRKWVGWLYADDDPRLAADVARHADMTGHELVLDPHSVADRKRLARHRIEPAVGARQGEWK
jgi:hypothetical protein